MTIFYRTGRGRKAHASEFCANARRSIFTGDIAAIPAGELSGWAGCLHCCSTEQLSFLADAGTTTAPAKCANTGVVNSRRIYSECRTCGKSGKVNRSTGTIKAHFPQAA